MARQYLCSKCGKQVLKKPLLALKDWASASIADFGGLGQWRCSCGQRSVKVVETK